MAAKELRDYISYATPDKAVTLNINPSRVIERIGLKQEKFSADDTDSTVINRRTAYDVYVELLWSVKNESDAGTIFDFWNDTAKGNGTAYSFIWTHPTDGHQYVVKFASSMRRTIFNNFFFTFPSCTLKILGFYV